MANTFYIIDDYTSQGTAIWDDFLYNEQPKLPTRPRGEGWAGRLTAPEGTWGLANGMYSMGSAADYKNAGIRRPAFVELPVVFCVKDDGSVEEQCKVSAAQAREFIAARI